MASIEHDTYEKGTAGHIEQVSTGSGGSAKDVESTTTPEWTPEEERKIVWKVDWHVFPMLCIVFGLSLLDRSNISAAFIAEMNVDLNLIENRYVLLMHGGVSSTTPSLKEICSPGTMLISASPATDTTLHYWCSLSATVSLSCPATT